MAKMRKKDEKALKDRGARTDGRTPGDGKALKDGKAGKVGEEKAARKEEAGVRLVEGSEYAILSIGSRDKPMETRGTFRGYTFVGNHAEGICIELDQSHGKLSGRMRVIPTHMLISIDVMKEAMQDKVDEEDTSHRSYL